MNYLPIRNFVPIQWFVNSFKFAKDKLDETIYNYCNVSFKSGKKYIAITIESVLIRPCQSFRLIILNEG